MLQPLFVQMCLRKNRHIKDVHLFHSSHATLKMGMRHAFLNLLLAYGVHNIQARSSVLLLFLATVNLCISATNSWKSFRANLANLALGIFFPSEL